MPFVNFYFFLKQLEVISETSANCKENKLTFSRQKAKILTFRPPTH